MVTPPVVLALKRTLPAAAGALANELANRLARWTTIILTPTETSTD